MRSTSITRITTGTLVALLTGSIAYDFWGAAVALVADATF